MSRRNRRWYDLAFAAMLAAAAAAAQYWVTARG